MSIKTRINPMGALGVKEYTLTVTTNPAAATCTLTYDGVSYSTKTAKVKAGTVISYSVYHSTYGTTSGSITMDSDKTLNCNGTYSSSTTYKYGLDSDITVYGSPSISNDGILSNLSASNRLVYPTDNMSSTNWHMHIKFKCTSTTSTYQSVVGRGSNSNSEYGCRFLVNSSGYLYSTSYHGSKIDITGGTNYSVLNYGWCIIDVTYNNQHLTATLQREKYNDYSTITMYDSSVTTYSTWNNYQAIGCQTYATSNNTWGRHYGATGCTID